MMNQIVDAGVLLRTLNENDSITPFFRNSVSEVGGKDGECGGKSC